MSIRPLLVIAALCSVGACGAGPTGTCYFDDQVGDQVCVADPTPPQSNSVDLPIVVFVPEGES